MTNGSMNDAAQPLPRVLAIDPISHGFGYALMEGPEVLVDWGLCNVGGSDFSAVLCRISELIRLYEPDVLIAEDCADDSSRRRERARTLISEIGTLGTSEMRVRFIPASMLRQLFSGEAPATKNEIATAIAHQLNELTTRLPPPRKPWMTEDKRMAIFDAAGLALAFYVADHFKTA